MMTALFPPMFVVSLKVDSGAPVGAEPPPGEVLELVAVGEGESLLPLEAVELPVVVLPGF